MAIYQPIMLEPNNKAVDPAKDITFSCVFQGSIATAYKITILTLNNTQVYTRTYSISENPLYNGDFFSSLVIGNTVLMPTGINSNFKWNVSFTNNFGDSASSGDILIKSRETPTLTINSFPATITQNNYNFSPFVFYYSKDGISLKWYQFTLYDSNLNILSQSDKIYSMNISYTAQGLETGVAGTSKAYYIGLTAENQDGFIMEVLPKIFNVAYASFSMLNNPVNIFNEQYGYNEVNWTNVMDFYGVSSTTNYSYINLKGRDDNAIKISDNVMSNIVPKMTSSTLPSGTVFDNGGTFNGYYSWHAFNDDLNLTPLSSQSWVKSGLVTISNPAIIGYRFSSPKIISKYTLISRNENIAPRSPKTWVFQGSNDGTTYIDLEAPRTVTSWASTPATNLSFLTNNKVAYLYYRIYITESNDTSYVGLGAFKMYELYPTTGTDISYDLTGSEIIGDFTTHLLIDKMDFLYNGIIFEMFNGVNNTSDYKLVYDNRIFYYYYPTGVITFNLNDYLILPFEDQYPSESLYPNGSNYNYFHFVLQPTIAYLYVEKYN